MVSFIFVSCISVVMQEISRCPVFSSLVLHTIAGSVKVFASGTVFGDLVYLGRISATCCLWKQGVAGIRLGQQFRAQLRASYIAVGLILSVDLLLFFTRTVLGGVKSWRSLSCWVTGVSRFLSLLHLAKSLSFTPRFDFSSGSLVPVVAVTWFLHTSPLQTMIIHV